MKMLALLEKNKTFWSLLGLSVFFFFLRFPSLIEPYWYGDEGIYEVIGQSLFSHHLLYRDIWDNKPPLLYLIYGLFDGDQILVRFFSLLAGLLSLIFLFLLTKLLFKSHRISIFIGFLYTLLFATPLLEGNIANAENFILLPVILAGFLIFKSVHQKKFHMLTLISAGLLVGIGFLLKIVALFDFAAFFLFLFFSTLDKINWKQFRKSITILLPFVGGFMLPIALTFAYFAASGIFRTFIQAAFFGNVGYVGWQNTFLGIPQGLLILKLLLLGIFVLVLFFIRKKLSSTTLFVLLWLAFALFSTYFSGRPYLHYTLVLVPAYTLFLGLGLTRKQTLWKYSTLGIFLLVSFMVVSYFRTYGLSKTYRYYNNATSYISGNKSVEKYQAFFDSKTPRDYALASYINTHTKPTDRVFIWGNSAQIYALSHKLPLNKYTVAYHISTTEAFHDTQQVLDTLQPKYIITLKETGPLPFRIPLYIMRFSISGATIYERSL